MAERRACGPASRRPWRRRPSRSPPCTSCSTRRRPTTPPRSTARGSASSVWDGGWYGGHHVPGYSCCSRRWARCSASALAARWPRSRRPSLFARARARARRAGAARVGDAVVRRSALGGDARQRPADRSSLGVAARRSARCLAATRGRRWSAPRARGAHRAGQPGRRRLPRAGRRGLVAGRARARPRAAASGARRSLLAVAALAPVARPRRPASPRAAPSRSRPRASGRPLAVAVGLALAPAAAGARPAGRARSSTRSRSSRLRRCARRWAATRRAWARSWPARWPRSRCGDRRRRLLALAAVPLLLVGVARRGRRLVPGLAATRRVHASLLPPLLAELARPAGHARGASRSRSPTTTGRRAAWRQHVPLARGWERQLDLKRNGLFYDGRPLTAARYRALARRQRGPLGRAARRAARLLGARPRPSSSARGLPVPARGLARPPLAAVRRPRRRAAGHRRAPSRPGSTATA